MSLAIFFDDDKDDGVDDCCDEEGILKETVSVPTACLLGSAALYFLYIMIWVKNLVILIVTPLHRWSWAFDFGISGIAFTIASAVFWYLDSKREVGYLAIQNQEEQNPERRGFSKR